MSGILSFVRSVKHVGTSLTKASTVSFCKFSALNTYECLFVCNARFWRFDERLPVVARADEESTFDNCTSLLAIYGP